MSFSPALESAFNDTKLRSGKITPFSAEPEVRREIHRPKRRDTAYGGREESAEGVVV